MKLNINNKEYPLKWGFAAFERYCDNNDCDLGDIESALTSEKIIISTRAIYNLAVAAIECGCKAEGIECDINYDTFRDWLDTQPQQVATDIIEDWKKSYYGGVTIARYFFGEAEESNETTTKKKPSSVK